MSLSTIDPVPALVVIDLQLGLRDRPMATPMSDVVRRTAQLAEAFRHHDLPVVLVTATGRPTGRTEAASSAGPRPTPADDFAEVLPELSPATADVRVTKQAWSAFSRTDLHEHLQDRSVTQVVLTGVATSIGVESTARAAYDLGYHVVLAIDAMTDPDPEAHRHSVEQVFPRLGERARSVEILDLVENGDDALEA